MGPFNRLLPVTVHQYLEAHDRQPVVTEHLQIELPGTDGGDRLETVGDRIGPG